MGESRRAAWVDTFPEEEAGGLVKQIYEAGQGLGVQLDEGLVGAADPEGLRREEDRLEGRG